MAGLTGHDQTLVAARPFRAPHHTVSPAALAGGTANPRPGEISLAHNGVLLIAVEVEFWENVFDVRSKSE